MSRTEIQEAAERTMVPAQPDADPVLMRQQELRQNIHQINHKIGELRQQRQMADDMIRDCELQTAGVLGAIREIEFQQNQKNQMKE